MHLAEITLYAHYASALINSDESGLTPAELIELDDIRRHIEEEYGPTAEIALASDSVDSYFGRPDYPPHSLPGNILDYDIFIQ